MPFRLNDSQQVVLVARGWVARDPADRNGLPPLATPMGQVALEVLVVEHLGRLWRLGTSDATIRPRRPLEEIFIRQFAQETGWPVVPVFVEQTSAMPDGSVRDWPQPDAGVERHLGYRLTWYALSFMTIC